MRRSVGISSLQSRQTQTAAFQTLSSQISLSQLETLKAQMDSFRTSLREFAVKHREEIRKDPVFRMHFQKMCSSLSIDPLAGPVQSSSSSSSFWSSILNLSDITYELSIQIIDISISTRPLNGGLITLPDLIRRICAARGIEGDGAVTEEDVKRAVSTMSPLGSGLEIIDLGGVNTVDSKKGSGNGIDRKALRSGSALVDSDSATVVGLAMGTGGRVTARMCIDALGWMEERVRTVLQEEMVEREGIAWVDGQSEEEGSKEWWVTGVVEWGE